MKELRDFIFGALLIGVAPILVFGFALVVGDLLQKLSHNVVSDTICFLVAQASLPLGLLAFACAISFRLRKQLLPRGYLVVEVPLGILVALLLYLLCFMPYALYH
jgi:hypothetical protein